MRVTSLPALKPLLPSAFCRCPLPGRAPNPSKEPTSTSAACPRPCPRRSWRACSWNAGRSSRPVFSTTRTRVRERFCCRVSAETDGVLLKFPPAAQSFSLDMLRRHRMSATRGDKLGNLLTSPKTIDAMLKIFQRG